jgi:type I site-specific restriction-modification system R (restriction) subunit
LDNLILIYILNVFFKFCLKKYQSNEDWQNVKQAEQNASQIIKRIKSDIKEMEKVRSQIVNELEDKRSSPVVIKIDEQLKLITKRLEKQAEDIDSISAPYYTYETRHHDGLFIYLIKPKLLILYSDIN